MQPICKLKIAKQLKLMFSTKKFMDYRCIFSENVCRAAKKV